MARWLGSLLLALLMVLSGDSIIAQSAVGPGSSETPGGPDLKTTLEKGLKARRPGEFAFIANVVTKVENGNLPRGLVQSTFLWARKKRPYPFPYFERGLKERAKKLGITL